MNKKWLQAAVALMMLSCTAAPPNTPNLALKRSPSQAHTTSNTQKTNKPISYQKSRPVQRNLNLNKDLLRSAKGRISSNASGDQLALKVFIKKPSFSTQSIDVNSITHLRGWVEGPNIPSQILNEDNFVLVSEGGQSTLTIKRVIRGKNRVVTVEGYSDANENDGVPGAQLKAFYSSPEDSTEVEVYFTWRSTAAALILEALLEQDATLAENVDMLAIQKLVNDLINYDDINDNSVIHPYRLDTKQIASDIFDAAGTVPIHTAGDTVPAPWLLPGGSTEVVIQNPQGEPFNSDLVLQITDPSSTIIEISAGNDRGTVSDISPGTWEAIATLPGLNGGVQDRVTVVVDEFTGDVTLQDSLGTDGNPLELPPVITQISNSSGGGGTGKEGDPISGVTDHTITLTGDGFDPDISDNTVKFGDVEAEIVSASETELVVKVPAGIEGTLDITVETDGQTSNNAEYEATRAVIDMDKPGGSAGDQVTLTVSGFNPINTASTIRFNGSVLDLEPDSFDSDSVTVTVPDDAITGVITVTPTDTGVGLPSPEFVIDAAVISEIPEAAVAGDEITIKGANLTNPSNVTINGVTVTEFTGIDDNTITLTVPEDATTGPIEVSTPQGDATSVDDIFIYQPPTITNVDPLNEEIEITEANPMTLTGDNYIGTTEVTIGGFVLDPSTYTVVDDNTIEVTDIPDEVSTGKITVTNPAGTATFDQTFAVYSDVINFIGPPTASYLGVQGGVVQDIDITVPNVINDFTDMTSLHGINTDFGSDLNDPAEYNIYVTTLNHRIFKFDQDGHLVWQAGTGIAALNNTVEVTLDQATFSTPEDTTNDWAGNVYVADTSNNAIRKITPDGRVITLAKVWGPEGVEVSPYDGALYATSNKPDNNPTEAWVVRISDLDNLPTELQGDIDPNTVTIDAGKAGTSNVDIIAGGPVTGAPAAPDSEVPLASETAIFDHLEGLGMDGDGNIFVADVDVKQVRKIDLQNNKITVFTTLNNPAFTMHEIRVDLAGNLFIPAPVSYNCTGYIIPPYCYGQWYIPDFKNGTNSVFKISPDGQMNIVAGTNSVGVQDGDPLEAATFLDPRGIDIAPDGSLFVADNGWGVRKVERFQPINNIPPQP